MRGLHQKALGLCFAQSVPALNSASSMTTSTETASPARDPIIGRLKMNMAAPPTQAVYGEPMMWDAL
jgi:hypothetical protein